MDYVVDPQAVCESRAIGAGTRIAAFARVLEGAEIGRDCEISSYSLIEADVVVGDRVTIRSGVRLSGAVRIGEDVLIDANAAFTQDGPPRGEREAAAGEGGQILVERGACIGANATILAGVAIRQNARVGAGSVVTRSVPPNAIVVGNPAQITGYVDSLGPFEGGQSTRVALEHEKVVQTGIRGVTLHALPIVEDMRGRLTVGEFPADIPFVPRRYFMVFDVPSREVRGEHAHRTCELFLLCVNGSCSVVADDGDRRQEFTLDQPGMGIYLPPMVWGIQYKYSPDAKLLVFASDPYDSDDYIRDYRQFLREIKRG